MKIQLILCGKSDTSWIEEGFQEYVKRLKRYIDFQYEVLVLPKKQRSAPPKVQSEYEAGMILSALDPKDRVILLDEKGKEFSSRGFSEYLQKQMNAGFKRLVFIAGGAYGFDDSIRAKGWPVMSLSKMTYSHQMVRLIFAEQLYRAFTILRNEPYHHD